MKFSFILIVLLFLNTSLHSQEVPILSYATNVKGQVQLEITASASHYYILNVRAEPTGDFEWATSMTLGETGNIFITEPLAAYPLEHYQVLEYPIANPTDIDGDGVDDFTEFSNIPLQSPFNFAEPINDLDGTVAIDDLVKFQEMSNDNLVFAGGDFLEGMEFVKFFITGIDSDSSKIYFINMDTHVYHFAFAAAIDLDVGNDFLTGEVIYHPTIVANNGAMGTFSFNYSFGVANTFEKVQKTHELIAANMPFLQNNLSYFILPLNELAYNADIDLYNNSRIPILFETDIYGNIDYLALNVAEGFGFFRKMDLDFTPDSKDLVLYETLPNSLPRVGGIMTSFIQTPLSHVNLRAIQDNLPNAFIRNPLAIDSISILLYHFVYYKVEQDHYFIRQASYSEFNDWFDSIRPDEAQTPALNLSYTSILPLSDINFEMSDGFGAKCANVATMQTFDFPAGTIPDGFGVPFYFYQEFMTYNGFFDDIADLLADPDFQSNLDTRITMLDELRSNIKNAPMPQWMLDELQTMHESFPEGTSIRCRSSTNNEDLPGFSGAGLYDSKTQHPDEGHISKSIKQVYASMWNFKAFDERDFYRIDQYATSMGVLCHPNYTAEKANGVAVSTDPVYQTTNTFYLNTQLGEDLVTNPEELSFPEEILLDRISTGEDDYTVLRYSNLVEAEQLLMEEVYLDEMRGYLTVIHDEFQILYDALDYESFAMDIEYKITSDDQLIIKQARPWASFWEEIGTTATQEIEQVNLKYFPNPVSDDLNLQCDCEVVVVRIINALGREILVQAVDFSDGKTHISTASLAQGMYILNGLDKNGEISFAKKFFKR